jgi:S-DNA-T family DNA segregation ATPase FtsK/SpoIIIE
MKAIASAVLFVVVAMAAAVVGVVVWLGWEIGNRAINALDGLGPGIFTAGALVTFGAFVLVVVGGAIYIVKALAARSRRIYARDGLYPVIDHGRGRYADLNEPGAQTLAVLASGRRPTAALAGRVIDAQWRNGSQPSEIVPDLPQLPEPAARFPTRVDVYGQPLPRALALPVGVDGAGQPVALPLRNLGNVLVGGLPGSGKSELLASMLAGLLRQDASGRTVQVGCIDTKLVSFGLLPELASLYAPPALSVEAAHDLVASLANEVQRRFELLHAARVRSLEELESTSGERLPYLVAFVDELADLTTDPDKARAARFLDAAMSIGRKGRAAGVALVMATQRPAADVVPSSLRNLAGAAVAFRVSRNHDSMAVLGEPGAETLPAVPGRCLVKRDGVVMTQALFAGLEGGQFDRFCAAQPLAQLQPEDGIPVDNWPTTAPTTAVVPVVGGCERLEPGREPDSQLAATMRRWYHDGISKTAICGRVWGYKDGPTWEIMTRVLDGEL